MLSPNIVSFIAAELILAGARVKFAAGSSIRVVNAGINDVEIGTAILHSGKSSYAAESAVGVKLNVDPGSRTCIAAGAIAPNGSGLPINKRAANGKVGDGSGNGSEVGIALEDAAADGDFVECLFTETPPISVVLGSTNGTAAAAADLAALKTETEKIGDDLRAIHAALIAKGHLIGT